MVEFRWSTGLANDVSVWISVECGSKGSNQALTDPTVRSAPSPSDKQGRSQPPSVSYQSVTCLSTSDSVD